MSHTYFAVHVHLVFSTKERRPWLRGDALDEVAAYLATAMRNHDTIVHIVGGHDDHVHALISPGSRTLIPDLVKEIKRTSSTWFKERWPDERDFAWQEGYGAFSVSHSNMGQVQTYIAHQSEHHKELSFADEFRGLLERHGIDYDERFYLG